MKLIVEISDDLYNVIKTDKYGLHKGKMYDIIRDGIPLNKNKGEWIPVSERLPKDSEDVLATNGVDMFVAWHNPDKGEGYPEKGWYSFDDNFDVRNPIIAWQPLPEPYKAESEKTNENG